MYILLPRFPLESLKTRLGSVALEEAIKKLAFSTDTANVGGGVFLLYTVLQKEILAQNASFLLWLP